MSFHCVVVTPEQQVADETVNQVVFPAYDGQMGILTDRAPMLAKLGKGELKLTLANNSEKIYQVEGGIAQMKDNNLTILTTKASSSDSATAE